MPDYHCIPLDFRRTRPELDMNPHFTYKKAVAKEAHSYADFHDARDALLLHRVPSASLYLEEVMAHWPISSSPQLQDLVSSTQASTERSSVATLIDFGEWISEQRPQSLLPPAPRLVRLPSSETAKVECRLSSPATPPKERTGKGPVLNPELRTLSSQFQKVSFSDDCTSSPSTRSITPVPSLTTSNYSRSSLRDISPCVTRRSPMEPLRSSPPGKTTTTVNKNPTDLTINCPCILKIGSPFPSPTFPQHDHLGWSSLPADPSRNSSYLPFRPVPDVNATKMHLPQPSPDAQEVSYIDWDDDKFGDSALDRIKKSFADLRAAERYITEANNRNRMEAARAVKETSEPTIKYMSSDTGGLSHELDPASAAVRDKHKTNPTKLRKKASIRNVSAPARSSSADSLTTPPSTGKKKRTNTTSSQPSSDVDEEKTRNGSVTKLVKRFLRARKEQ